MLASVVAQTTSGNAGQFDIFSLLLPLALAFLIFTMFRRQRKTQRQVKEMRTQMEPGTEVMTQFGLFGTIVSIDQENNKAVLELAPGTFATVHTQALSKVVEQVPAEDGRDEIVLQEDAAYDGASVPDDASSIDGGDRTPAGGSTAAGTTQGVESPEETMDRPAREQPAKDSRDARDTRDPRVNPDN